MWCASETSSGEKAKFKKHLPKSTETERVMLSGCLGPVGGGGYEKWGVAAKGTGFLVRAMKMFRNWLL